VAQGLDDLLVTLQLFAKASNGLLAKLLIADLNVVELVGLNLTLLLKSRDDILVLPANLGGETADLAESTTWLQLEDAESRWHDLTLDLVVWWWDTLEGLEALESLLAAGSLVWDHAANGAEKDLAWRAEVKGTTGWVGVASLAQKLQILELVTVEAARDVEVLAAHNDHTLTVQEGLGNNSCESAHQVASSVNNNWLVRKTHFSLFNVNKFTIF